MHLVKESIFSSSLRSFCKTFFGAIGIIIALIATVAISAMLSGAAPAPDSKYVMQLSYDANGSKKQLPESSPVLLKLDIKGVIGTNDLNEEVIQGALYNAPVLIKEKRIKGLLLNINTPGGSAVDSNGIYRAIKHFKEKYKLPVYAYVNGLCASGGMYSACAADKIYATPESIIGSVGIIAGPFFNFHNAMQKYGVKSEIFYEGKNKDELSPFKQWKDDEGNNLRPILAYGYTNFVDAVVKNRPKLSREKLINEYGAGIFNSQQAADQGYIDVPNTNYETAIRELATEAGISEKQKYQVLSVKLYRNVIDNIMESSLNPAIHLNRLMGNNPLGLQNPHEKTLYYYHQ